MSLARKSTIFDFHQINKDYIYVQCLDPIRILNSSTSTLMGYSNVFFFVFFFGGGGGGAGDGG